MSTEPTPTVDLIAELLQMADDIHRDGGITGANYSALAVADAMRVAAWRLQALSGAAPGGEVS